MRLHVRIILHILAAMSLKTYFASIPLLWSCATALPAGPGFWPNGTSSQTFDVHTSAAYSLIDTYDGSNWLSKFNVQAVSDLSLYGEQSNAGIDTRSHPYVFTLLPLPVVIFILVYRWLRRICQRRSSSTARPVENARESGLHGCRHEIYTEPKRSWKKERSSAEQDCLQSSPHHCRLCTRSWQ